MMFTPREGDRQDFADSKVAYFAGRYQEAFENLDNRLASEKIVLKHLAEKPNDFNGAYHRLPKNVRLICAHAYQSYIFNRLASERVSRYGLQCIEGDLVSLVAEDNLNDDLDVLEAEEGILPDEKGSSSSVDMTVNLSNDFQRTQSNSSSSADTSDSRSTIHVVTREDIESNR